MRNWTDLRQENQDRVKRVRGYVLMDVMMALFIFSVGFAAIYGLHDAALGETRQALRQLEAANLAQSILEDMASQPWPDNIATGKVVPGGSVKGQRGVFSWQVVSDWVDSSVLLRVRVRVSWPEKSNEAFYELQTLYDMN